MVITGVQLAQVLICAASAAFVLLAVVQYRAIAHSSRQLLPADWLVRLYRTDSWVSVPVVLLPQSIGVGRGLSSRAPPESSPRMAAVQQRRR